MRLEMLVAGLSLLLLAGCGRKSAGELPTTTKSAAPSAGVPDRANPRLETIKLWVGDQELVAEVARKPVELMTGMMFRTNMIENEAMLFLLPSPQRASFYMRNTTVPLSAAYLDADGTILEIHDLQPLNETPVEAAAANVQFVVETPQGWFQRHSIRAGAVVRTQYGALREINWTTLRRARPR